MARYDVSEGQGEPRRLEMLRCERVECARIWRRSERPGPTPRFCSDSCKQANYRALRKLTGLAREAFLGEQEQRRRTWESLAPSLRQEQEQERDVVPQAQVAADRIGPELDRLARDIGAARARGALGNEAQRFYQRFSALKEQAGRHTAAMADSADALESGLRLVELQLAALLSGGS